MQHLGRGHAGGNANIRQESCHLWHLDEVFLTIRGELHYLWRAVDQEGNILDILVQRQCTKKAAKKFIRKLLKG
jgi:putative transposase